MKPRIFIGSSSESAEIASYVRTCIGSDYECIIWNDNFFELNSNTYENLVKNAISFDYAIYIGGRDDSVFRLRDGTSKLAPRDNIYLEFGLYAGILSPSRSYFLIDNACTIASDLLGITVLRYSSKQTIEECCTKIKQHIQAERQLSRIQLLPSTSLAIGYFENFLKKMEYVLPDLNTIEVCGHSYHVEHFKKSLEIVMPETVDVDWAFWAAGYKRKHQLEKVVLNCHLREVGLLIDYHSLTDDQHLRFVDLPQTLRASFRAVELVQGINYIGNTKILETAKRKEVSNFILTLTHLIEKTDYIKSITTIKTVSS